MPTLAICSSTARQDSSPSASILCVERCRAIPNRSRTCQEGVSAQWFANHAASASATGALAHPATLPVNTGLVWFDAAGRETGRVEVPPGQYEQVALSRDGRRALAERRVSPAVADLWIIDLERGGATRFTSGASVSFYAAWSPDGERVVFSSDRNGPETLFVKPSNGTGSEQVLYQSPVPLQAAAVWSPDGSMSCTDLSPTTNLDLWVMPMGGGGGCKNPFVYAQSPASGATGPDFTRRPLDGLPVGR